MAKIMIRDQTEQMLATRQRRDHWQCGEHQEDPDRQRLQAVARA